MNDSNIPVYFPSNHPLFLQTTIYSKNGKSQDIQEIDHDKLIEDLKIVDPEGTICQVPVLVADVKYRLSFSVNLAALEAVKRFKKKHIFKELVISQQIFEGNTHLVKVPITPHDLMFHENRISFNKDFSLPSHMALLQCRSLTDIAMRINRTWIHYIVKDIALFSTSAERDQYCLNHPFDSCNLLNLLTPFWYNQEMRNKLSVAPRKIEASEASHSISIFGKNHSKYVSEKFPIHKVIQNFSLKRLIKMTVNLKLFEAPFQFFDTREKNDFCIYFLIYEYCNTIGRLIQIELNSKDFNIKGDQLFIAKSLANISLPKSNIPWTLGLEINQVQISPIVRDIGRFVDLNEVSPDEVTKNRTGEASFTSLKKSRPLRKSKSKETVECPPIEGPLKGDEERITGTEIDLIHDIDRVVNLKEATPEVTKKRVRKSSSTAQKNSRPIQKSKNRDTVESPPLKESLKGDDGSIMGMEIDQEKPNPYFSFDLFGENPIIHDSDEDLGSYLESLFQ